MLDDCSLSRTGIEWGNLVSERKQNKSVSKFYMYNHIENYKDLFQPSTLYVPRVTKVNFLSTLSIHHQEKML